MTALIHPSSTKARILSRPDWRFQWLASVPALIKHDARVSKKDVPDWFIREILLPFARRRHGQSTAMQEHDYQGMSAVFESYNGKADGCMSAFVSEGCALAGAPLDCKYLMTSHQDFYEAVFFDIRRHLDNVEAIVALVFEPLSKTMPQSSQDLESKVIAYGLGVEQFHRWTLFDDSAEILALRWQLEKLEAFRASLEVLGLPFAEAWSQALHQLLCSVRAGDIPDGKPEFTSRPQWQRRLERLVDTVPEYLE